MFGTQSSPVSREILSCHQVPDTGSYDDILCHAKRLRLLREEAILQDLKQVHQCPTDKHENLRLKIGPAHSINWIPLLDFILCKINVLVFPFSASIIFNESFKLSLI